MNYTEAIDSLYSLRLFGTKFGLENSFRLANLFGNPQKHLRFIHVAGTNGKGSTCAILESIYRSAQFKTGFFTSPHLVSFTERVQVCRSPISEENVAALTSKVFNIIQAENADNPDREQWEFRPTFFEVITIMALIHFVESRCDLVIWETGMGGRLDATNIVTPLAAIITNVQLDHETWLGSTTAEIAREKAGIIKPGVPVITGCTDPAALQVIRETSKGHHSPLRIPGDARQKEAAAAGLQLPGAHQLANAACALETVDILQPILPVSKSSITKGLHEVTWPGRLQLLSYQGRQILLDGAHNPDGAQTLRKAILAQYSRREIALVLGLFKDKAWQRICQILIPLARKVYLTPVESERSANPAEVENFCRQVNPNAEINSYASLPDALNAALANNFVVVSGSLHLVGEAMQALGVSPFTRSERSLNEWSAVRPAPEKS
jgi:dihydrofolate synthase/folylpolyglutamate synthase